MSARVGLVVVALASIGCLTVPERGSELQESLGGTEMSPAELRIKVRDLAGRFSGELETMADDLATATRDPDIQIRLIRFKVDAIPQMQMALFQPDPVAALIDAWALLAQIDHALAIVAERGGATPEQQAHLQDGLTSMEDELENLWRRVSRQENVDQARSWIHEWAAAHPLQSLATRQSTVGLLAEVTARSGVSALGAAAYLLEDTQDLTRRLEVLASYIPKQARWQAELFLRETLADPSLLRSGRTPEEVVDALANVILMTADLPNRLAAERDLLLNKLHEERIAAQRYVTGEREAVTNALREERATVMAESELVGQRLIDHTFDRLTELVDHVLLRALVVGSICSLGLIAAAWIVSRRR